MNTPPETYCRPTLFRHLAIIVYDLLLLLAILLLAGAVAVIFNGGEAIGEGNPFFLLYLLAVSFFFYGWFWTHGGQTLGMRSWKVYLFSNDGSPITWYQASVRFITAFISFIPVGLGIWWPYLSKNNQSWTNSLSATRIHYSEKSKIKPLSRLS